MPQYPTVSVGARAGPHEAGPQYPLEHERTGSGGRFSRGFVGSPLWDCCTYRFAWRAGGCDGPSQAEPQNSPGRNPPETGAGDGRRAWVGQGERWRGRRMGCSTCWLQQRLTHAITGSEWTWCRLSGVAPTRPQQLLVCVRNRSVAGWLGWPQHPSVYVIWG